ncbi:MAG TPA: cellulase family glycosylhydrolase [Solirubrobacteraceae bacterium]|nr:cellulase family glycosylhydrolase [Solirubrobacteraceae bacterium]
MAAAPAHASSSQTTVFEAPRDLLNPQTRPAALVTLQHLGVHAIRVILTWNDVAPTPDAATPPAGFDATNPASYDWGQYDDVMAAAAARGWKVLLTVTGQVPRWATPGGVDHLTRPDDLDFEGFMTAVGRHYGKQVKLISIWNEPNQPQFLLPQFQDGQPASPRIYRGLYQAAIAGLRASGNYTGMQVLFGETSPVGTGHVVAPLTFLRDALCLSATYKMSSSCSKLPMAGYAHHAYTTKAGPFYVPPANDVTIGVLSRLSTALDRAGAAGAIPRGTPIYLTEFGIQSQPDPYLGVTLAQQAEYLGISEHIAYENPRVKLFSQYLLRDDPTLAGPPSVAYSGFQSGLETAGGRKKPSYSSWPIPLTVTRTSTTGVSLWGLVRPATGATNVEVEVKDGGGAYKRLLTRRTTSAGYWTIRSTFRSGRVWRVVWTSAAGVVYTGSAIRAYSAAGKLQR